MTGLVLEEYADALELEVDRLRSAIREYVKINETVNFESTRYPPPSPLGEFLALKGECKLAYTTLKAIAEESNDR